MRDPRALTCRRSDPHVREVQRFATGFGDRADDNLGYRRHFPSLLIIEISEAKPRARVKDRMLGYEAIEAEFHLLGKRMVGRALIGKFRMSADRRYRTRIKQRCTRW